MDTDGKRMTDDKGSGVLWIQLCVTTTTSKRIVVERAKKFLREDLAEARKDGRDPSRYLVLSQIRQHDRPMFVPEMQDG